MDINRSRPGLKGNPAPNGKLTVVCADWRPLHKNTLCGFALIHIRQFGPKIHDLAVHAKGASMWAALPSKPWIRDGSVVTDDAGKVRYSVLFEFDRKEVRDAFSAAVIRAVCERFPAALALEEAAT